MNRRSTIVFALFLIPAFLSAAPLYSPTWGFFLDLPEGYEYVEGNNTDRYSFRGPGGAMFDIAVYTDRFQNVGQLSDDVNRRLENSGDAVFFDYEQKTALLLELNFRGYAGWGLCLELTGSGTGGAPALLLALAYAPQEAADLFVFHLSALDSLAPSENERRRPGPITEFSYPRGDPITVTLAGTNINTRIREHDAEAAQALIDREFALMRYYEFADTWQEAWIRFYRAIYRDSWDRVADPVSRFIQNAHNGLVDGAHRRAFAEKALSWVQNFQYERNLAGSDFVNLVSAITEGRGDCDSRAMLWAIMLMQADIPAAIMVSRHYSHAMGLADIAGSGARFASGGVNWLVAETTSTVDIGLINQELSGVEHWLGILFE